MKYETLLSLFVQSSLSPGLLHCPHIHIHNDHEADNKSGKDLKNNWTLPLCDSVVENDVRIRVTINFKNINNNSNNLKGNDGTLFSFILHTSFLRHNNANNSELSKLVLKPYQVDTNNSNTNNFGTINPKGSLELYYKVL